MYALHLCLFQDLCIWDLVLPPDFQEFPQATLVEMVKFLGMALVDCPGSEVIKLFSCSTQQSMKFILLINVKMPTIVGILTFISRINDWLW